MRDAERDLGRDADLADVICWKAIAGTLAGADPICLRCSRPRRAGQLDKHQYTSASIRVSR